MVVGWSLAEVEVEARLGCTLPKTTTFKFINLRLSDISSQMLHNNLIMLSASCY